MRAKLMVLWSKPQDRDAFDRDYLDAHLGLAGELPGLRELRTWVLRSKQFHRCAELVFDAEPVLREALTSPAGEALAMDAGRLETAYDVTSSSHIALADTRPGTDRNPGA